MNQRKISYSTYLDKVYGCFLGKTVIGTLGAPYLVYLLIRTNRSGGSL